MSSSASASAGSGLIDRSYQQLIASINVAMQKFKDNHPGEHQVTDNLKNILGGTRESRQLFLFFMKKKNQDMFRDGVVGKSGDFRGPDNTRVTIQLCSDDLANFPMWHGLRAENYADSWALFQTSLSAATAATADTSDETEEGAPVPPAAIQYNPVVRATLAFRIASTQHHTNIINNVMSMQARLVQLETENAALQQQVSAQKNAIEDEAVAHEAELQSMMEQKEQEEDDAEMAVSRAVAELKLAERKNKELRVSIGHLKQRLTKQAKRDAKAQEAAAESVMSKADVKYQDALALLTDTLTRHLEMLHEFAANEQAREISYKVLPLLLPSTTQRKEAKVSGLVTLETLASIIGLGRSSLLFQNSLKKADQLEEAIHSNGDEVTLDMLVTACSHIVRATRSDATSEPTILRIENNWHENCEVSPDTGDVITLEGVAYNVFYQYKTTNAIYDSYEVQYGKTDHAVGLTTYKLHKPFNIREGKVNTCLCVKCEDFRLACRFMKISLRVLDRPYLLHRRIRLFLMAIRIKRCVMRREKLPANGRLSTLGREGCKFTLMQSLALLIQERGRLGVWYRPRNPPPPLYSLRDIFDGKQSLDAIASSLVCEDAIPSKYSRGKVECLGACSDTDICTTCREGKVRSKYLLRDLDLENHATLGYKPEERVTFQSYSKKSSDDTNDPEKMCLLYQHRTDPAVFRSYFDELLLQYVYHLGVIKRQKHAEKELLRNLLPHIIRFTMDFSQNLVQTERKDAIQSEHWSSASTTLFVIVATFLCMETWNASFGPNDYCVGQEVSYEHDPGDGGGVVYMYGELAAEQDLSDLTMVNILDVVSNTIVRVSCVKVHARKIITVPIMVYSDDKDHDTHAVRSIIENIILGPAGWLETQTDYPGLKDRFTHVMFDSDGAASHFKQKGTLHFMAALKREMLNSKIHRDYKVTWHFGPPGHGKGPHNGFGGIQKNKLKKYFLSFDIHISSSYQVYEYAKDIFDSAAAHTRYDTNPRIEIKRTKIYWLASADIVRPGVGKKGKKKRSAEDTS